VIALAVFSLPVLYYLETRFSYHLTEVYMQDHAIPEDISFSCGRSTDIRLNPTSDQIFYLACLPSEVSTLRSLRLSFSHFRTLEIDGQCFRSGDEIFDYVSSLGNEPVTMRLFAPRGELLYDGYVQFMFADSVPTMYLTTSENAIDIVNATEYEATVKPHVSSTMVITGPDGTIDVVTDADIYRHGNTSFDFFDQKPYNLGLSNKLSLLGMEPGKKWVLKSNGQYATVLMKNKAAFDIARMTEMESAPDSRYINLYINGRYIGLYLLCQNIQAPEFLSDAKAKALIERDVKYDMRPNTFDIKGMGMTIHYPDSVSPEEISMIETLFSNALEAVDNGDDPSRYIDTDSFIKMYMLQDYLVQTDLDGDSLYFYIGDDDRIHAGPIWDFDCSAGHITSGPYHDDLTIRSRHLNDFGRLFFTSLEHSEDFKSKAEKYYTGQFSSVIRKYAENSFESDASSLESSLAMSTMACDMYPVHKETDDDPKELKRWLIERADFLDRYYSDKEDYDLVRFDFTWGSMTAAVRHGEKVGPLPDDDHPGNTEDIWGEVTGFVDMNGNTVSDDTPINGSTYFTAVYAERED
jgi:hypothetical protein